AGSRRRVAQREEGWGCPVGTSRATPAALVASSRSMAAAGMRWTVGGATRSTAPPPTTTWPRSYSRSESAGTCAHTGAPDTSTRTTRRNSGRRNDMSERGGERNEDAEGTARLRPYDAILGQFRTI